MCVTNICKSSSLIELIYVQVSIFSSDSKPALEIALFVYMCVTTVSLHVQCTNILSSI